MTKKGRLQTVGVDWCIAECSSESANNMILKDTVRSEETGPELYIVTENRDEDKDTGAILVASIFKHCIPF